MKMTKLVTAGALALATIGAMNAADVTVRLSGSTAYRAATHQAILSVLGGTAKYGYAGTTLGSAGSAIFTLGTSPNKTTVITKWSGSVGGVTDLVQDTTYSNWYDDDGTLTTAGKASYSHSDGVAHKADVALSDSYASSTGIKGPNAITDTVVGIVPFLWVKGKSDNATTQAVLDKITDITALNAQTLLGGVVPASLVTGDEADAGVYIFPVGRDHESGTRLCAFAESGFGIFNTPLQYTPTVASSKITKITADTTGEGSTSGGTLAGWLATPIKSDATVDFADGNGAVSGLDFGLIGYVGLGDVVAKGLQTQVLKYNGASVFNGTDFDWSLLYSGKYTFWAYEHLMYRTSGTAAAVKTVADSIATKLISLVVSPSGLNLNDMSVARSVEGGVITHK